MLQGGGYITGLLHASSSSTTGLLHTPSSLVRNTLGTQGITGLLHTPSSLHCFPLPLPPPLPPLPTTTWAETWLCDYVFRAKSSCVQSVKRTERKEQEGGWWEAKAIRALERALRAGHLEQGVSKGNYFVRWLFYVGNCFFTIGARFPCGPSSNLEKGIYMGTYFFFKRYAY